MKNYLFLLILGAAICASASPIEKVKSQEADKLDALSQKVKEIHTETELLNNRLTELKSVEKKLLKVKKGLMTHLGKV